MFSNLYFCFLVKQQAFQLISDYTFTRLDVFFRFFSSLPPSSSILPSSQPSPKLTLVHPFGIKNLNALAYLGKNGYLCIEMSWKGLISRMSDECLITLETVVSFCIDCQAVMRKFTLAEKSFALSAREIKLSTIIDFNESLVDTLLSPCAVLSFLPPHETKSTAARVMATTAHRFSCFTINYPFLFDVFRKVSQFHIALTSQCVMHGKSCWQVMTGLSHLGNL